MMMERNIQTIFGIAKLNESTGYYRVQSSKKGFNNRYLHHLIWESHYQRTIPKDCVIHHINNDKSDNRIQNLVCVPKKVHDSFHSRHRSQETIKKIRDTLTNSHARIVKNGYLGKKQRYCIQFNGKRIKTSINPSSLIEWFNKNYPDEKLDVGGVIDEC